MIVADDCRGFVVVTFAALVADNVLVDKASIAVPHKIYLLFLSMMLSLLMLLMFWIQVLLLHFILSCS